MTEAEKEKAIQEIVEDFNKAIAAACSSYLEQIRAIIKESDEKKAKEIKDQLK